MKATLNLIPGLRERTRCSYWDYAIDSQRLAILLDVGDFIPPFGWLSPEVEDHFAKMLLRKCKSDLHTGRIPLFVCPECADYGCGVVTCAIERVNDSIEWFEFGMEKDYEDSLHQEGFDKTLRVSFNCSQYFGIFSRFLLT